MQYSVIIYYWIFHQILSSKTIVLYVVDLIYPSRTQSNQIGNRIHEYEKVLFHEKKLILNSELICRISRRIDRKYSWHISFQSSTSLAYKCSLSCNRQLCKFKIVHYYASPTLAHEHTKNGYGKNFNHIRRTTVKGMSTHSQTLCSRNFVSTKMIKLFWVLVVFTFYAYQVRFRHLVSRNNFHHSIFSKHFKISDGFFITLSFLRDKCGYINYTYVVSPVVCQILGNITRPPAKWWFYGWGWWEDND